MSERKIVHGDARFERFRHKLADVVTLAINNGIKVSQNWYADRECFCPIGCHVSSPVHAPTATQSVKLFKGLTHDQASDFINGFGMRGHDVSEKPSPYHRLGRMYAERFP